jgi:hypothetical protein
MNDASDKAALIARGRLKDARKWLTSPPSADLAFRRLRSVLDLRQQ